MKKWPTGLIMTIALLGVGVAVAAGGDRSDPLVPKSYLEGTYLPGLSEKLQGTANAKTDAVYKVAADKLDTLGQTHLTQLEGGGVQELRRSDTIDVKPGVQVVTVQGEYKVTAGAFANVTTGESVTLGGAMAQGHRYIATGSGTSSLTLQSDTGTASLQGAYTLREGNGAVLPFTDVLETDWYYQSVQYVYDKNLLKGTSDHLFSPTDSMTRGMLATVLYRLSGETVAEGTPFADVPQGLWYSQGVTWASSQGIVLGMGNGTFHPDGIVTRQQMAVMLYRYVALYQKGDVSARGELATFPDGSTVATWATKELEWAVGAGIFSGRDTGVLDPEGHASRGEVSAMLQRFEKFST